MKRPTYTVVSTDGHRYNTSAWNSAIRSIEARMRVIARAEGKKYVLQGSRSTRGDEGAHVFGHRIWATIDGAKLITFTITLEAGK